jgi:hypothetical protein
MVVTICISSAFFLYNVDRYSLIFFGDSVSHLVRAREIVDSSNPGLLEQLGTNWLPLPHLLLLPFTLIDPLFRTGFAGLAVSLPCLAMTSVILFKIIKSQVFVGYVAILGALLFASNPNVIYLGIIPMTEAPFMFFFVTAAYFFQKWISGPRKYLSVGSLDGGKILSRPILRGDSWSRSPLFPGLLLCSVFISLATLTRYEGWILPPFFVSFVIASTLGKRYYYTSKYKVEVILISTLSFSGIILWLAWNMYAFDNPLEFANSPYFSAASHALETSINRDFLFLQPWNVASLYSLTAYVIFGPVLLASAILGYLLHRISGKDEERKRRRNLFLFLALPPIFTLFTMVVGIGEINPKTWFNSRFLVLLAPLLILLTSFFLARLLGIIGPRKHIVVGCVIFIFFAYQLITPVLGTVTFLSATEQFYENRPPRPIQIKAADVLSSIYDGSSKILIVTGSSQQNKIMQASSIPLKQFEQILESGSHKDSFREPWSHVKYIVLGKKPDSSGTNVANYWLDRQPLLQKHFTVRHEDEYHIIMELSKSSPPPLPTELNQGTMIEKHNEVTSLSEAENNLLMHDHLHLTVSIDNKSITVPANIGIDPEIHKIHSLDLYGPQKSPLHTHTTSGTIHVESKIITNYTLGDFLDVWGIPINRRDMGDLLNVWGIPLDGGVVGDFLNVWGIPLEGKIVKTATVDGKQLSDFRNHVLGDGEKINLVLCSNVTSLYLDEC